MTSDAITPQQWLAKTPLRPGELLYAVISSTSTAQPLAAWRQHESQPAVPLWANTPYADWLPVMPWLLCLTGTEAFLNWAAHTDAQDWGWLAISSAPPELIAEHLRGLTQVFTAPSDAVFFRFWDGRYFLTVLQQLGATTSDVLPVFDRYWVNGQPVAVGQGANRPAQDFPWWQVPEDLLCALVEQDSSSVIDNLMCLLKETAPLLYNATAESVLRQKVESYLAATGSALNFDHARFTAHLQQEQSND
ncbi:MULTISPECIES: DUF4123 domain-containing protein [unclassified Pseudomonas]|uniref:DUF4123 domain-containing protein n=1 Tax=unclassified Pseudomonas TaxID=196821 RepID=UPI0028D708AE|nr:DUF4123 domain-containing protein [uncultured Pseudomonas sp.]